MHFARQKDTFELIDNFLVNTFVDTHFYEMYVRMKFKVTLRSALREGNVEIAGKKEEIKCNDTFVRILVRGA